MKSRDKQMKSSNSGKKMFRGTVRCRIFSKGKRKKGNGQKRLTTSLKICKMSCQRRTLSTNSENALEKRPKKRDSNRMRERGNGENALENRLKKRDAIRMKKLKS